MNPIQSATFDLQILATHKQFKNDGKTKKEAWEFIDKNYNIMNVGLPVFQMVDEIWEE